MFCSKCGSPIPDNSAFCENCGSPVSLPEQPAEKTVDTAPVQTQPEEQPTAATPEYPQEPASPQEQFPDEPQQYGYSYQPAPPAAPKKPMSPNTKKIIIFSAIGAAALAVILVLLFVVIIPAIKDANTTKISLADYRTIQFYDVDYDTKNAENELLNGKISGSVIWDAEKLANDIKTDKTTAEKILKNYASSLSKEQTLNGKTFSTKFTDASKDDVITATVYWPGDGDGNLLSQLAEKTLNDRVDQLEEKYDVKIKRETTTAEIKISDVLEKQNISVREMVEIDLLGKIADNSNIDIQQDYGEYYDVRIKEFSFEDQGFKYTHSKNSSYVAVYRNDKKLCSLSLYLSSTSYIKNGDTITLSFGKRDVSSLEKNGIKLTRDSIEYTVKHEGETTAPTTTAPATTAPETTAPETTAPQTTAPETTAAPTTEQVTTEAATEATNATGATS